LLWLFDTLPIALAILLGAMGSRERKLSEIQHQYTYAAHRYQSRMQRFKDESERWELEKQEWHSVANQREAELKQVQEDLNEAESDFQRTERVISRGKRQWEATFDAVHDLLLVTDDQDRVVRCNLASTQALQTDFSGIIGKQLVELFYGDEAPGEQFPAQGAELTFPKLSGWHEVTSHPLEIEPGQPGTIFVIRNISERVQSAMDLQRQKQYFETLVKNLPVAIVTLRMDNTIVDCNPAFESLFGYKLDDIQGEALDPLISLPEDIEATRGFSNAVIQGETVHSVTQRKRQDGSAVDVEMFGIPVILWGKQIGVLGLYHDLSELVTEAVEEEPKVKESKSENITSIEGIGPVYAGKLGEAGVHTTGDLLQAATSRKGRSDLAEQTGISANLILAWTNRADLMRVPGVGEEFSDLLEAAGVDTVKELRRRNPENLFTALHEVNEEKNLVRRTPSQAEVNAWVEAAKALDPILTY
jgi:PAS domain S-box-containing protein